MKAFELTAKVNQNRLLQIEVPEDISPGKVRLLVLIPDEDIQTLEDGDPVKGIEV